jgi:Lrp/AsnC family leucine-responsive transcriptional regulator
MDQVDISILKCLKENAREKSSNISKKINLSVSAVIERIKKMEVSGVIKKYTVELDQKQIGNDMVAYIEVRLEHPKYYNEFTNEVQNSENIISCCYITGDFDFLLKAMAGSSEELEQIHKKIKSIQGVSYTKTYFVLSTIKNDLSVIPEIE